MRLFRFGILVACYTAVMTSSPSPIQSADYDPSTEKYVPIPDWHREIIEKLMAKYRAIGFKGRTWEEFEQELNQELLKR